jgi:hypothetical protein
VTEGVGADLAGRGFADARFLETLDIHFAGLFFTALDSYAADPATAPSAWVPLFEQRSRRGIAPLQFALAGMNAHINRDLPVGLVQTFVGLGIEMERPSPQSADFDRVNGVLATSEAEVRARTFTPLMAELHRDFDGVDDVAANWSVQEARAAAWVNGAALWHLRSFPTLGADYLETLDGMVGFAGRGLLLPLG